MVTWTEWLKYAKGSVEILSKAQVSTVEPRLSKSPLSEPSVIRTLFQILKSLKTI